MLSKLIVNFYGIFVEICLWLSLIFFLLIGWHFQILIGEDVPSGRVFLLLKSISGFKGAIVGALVWFLLAVMLLGRFLMLGDIRTRVKNIEEHISAQDRSE